MTDLDSGAELHRLIDRTMADLDVPVARLHDTALRRGRASRRRRRAGAALASVAVVAGLTAATLPALGGGTGRAGDVATDPGAAAPSLPASASGWWDMPAKAMAKRLLDVLPAGLELVELDDGSADRAPGEPVGGGWVWVSVADHGAPAGAVNVLLYPPGGDEGVSVRQRITCPGNLEEADVCTEVRDDRGRVVGRTSRWTSGDVVVLEATRLTPEGAVVYAAASNSSDPKWGAESTTDRPRPPLDLAELRRVVDDPSWQRWSPQD